MDTDLLSAELSQAQFVKISQMLYQLCGIRLTEGKERLVKARLMKRFWQMLVPGGHLLVGHSKSLTNSSREFKYVQPATYQK